jgi:XRE family transcriptional regulator, aerobic/anaerobic benzoate catabolism transcriptional regulator
MDDLERILASRSSFYAKADLALDTSGKTIEQSLRELIDLVARGPIAKRI